MLKKILYIIVILFLIFLIACTNTEIKGCTKESKICSDGSSVGRVFPDCEFAECPGKTINEEGCTLDVKLCTDGTVIGRSGPNCEFEKCPDTTVTINKCDDPNRKYIKNSEEECKRVQFLCEPSSEPFYDECGCGCVQKKNNEQTFCTEEQRNVDACIEIFQPVCGWNSPGIQCIRYPCANDFPNSCFACSDEYILYYTPGECPDDFNNLASVCFSDKCINAEIADTDEERAKGLMFRESLEEGMLFVYDKEDIYTYWMKNTLIPLDIIWIDKNFNIVHIENAVPCKADPCQTYNQDKSAMYVVEVNLGFVEENNINLGDKVNIQY